MKNIIIAFICTYLYTCSLNKKNNQTDDHFNFNQLFLKSQLKNKIKIINTKEYDYFKGNLSKCNTPFYAGLMKSKMYQLKNSENTIVVEEYIFNNDTSSKKAFQSILKYSDFTRQLKRKYYGERCYDIWDEQVYYSINKGTHVYLLTSVNNLYYKDGNTSVNDIFEANKEILLDDLYNELK